MERHVQVYYTGMASTVKSKTDTRRIMTLLDAKRIPYEAIDLCMEPTRKADIAGLPEKTLPVVLVQGESIGGFDDLQELEDDGQLELVVQTSNSETSSQPIHGAVKKVLRDRGNVQPVTETNECNDGAETRIHIEKLVTEREGDGCSLVEPKADMEANPETSLGAT